MNLRLNRFEKTAGAFVVTAVTLGLGAVGGVAVKNEWFARRVPFALELDTADGVHAGTPVHMAGLRVGEVTDVELEDDNTVRVTFTVSEKFATKVRGGSRVQMFRPYLLSDKILDVSPGDPARPPLAKNSVLPAGSTTDLLDVLTGRRMGSLVASFDHLAESLRVLGDAFADPRRSRAMVRTFDRLNPTLDALTKAADEVAKATRSANEILPAVRARAPELGTQLGEIVSNMHVLTTELNKLTPALDEVAPTLPQTSRRAVEALDETVVLLKAMQKSFFFRGGVREVREEEKRAPASVHDDFK